MCDGARKIEQVHLPRIHERQKVAIEVGLRFLRQLILDTQLPELLTGPFARVPVACYCVDAIVFQKARKLCDDAFGGEWWLDLPYSIEHSGGFLAMADCEGETVGGTARWVCEGEVANWGGEDARALPG